MNSRWNCSHGTGGAVAAYTLACVIGVLVFGRRLRRLSARRLLLDDNVVRGVVAGDLIFFKLYKISGR